MFFSKTGTVLLSGFTLGAAAIFHEQCAEEYFNSLLPSGASIINLGQISAGGSFGQGAADTAYPSNATNLPASCGIIVNVTSSATSAYTFGLILPDEWNKRFMAVGNGGFSGGINWASMNSLVPYGFATMSTNTGHNSTDQDMDWALNNEESKKDWGYRALHGSTVIAKQITADYYEGKVAYSYYAGCSTGGKQGMKEVQRFPEEFDGVVVGPPAWWSTRQQGWQMRVSMINLPENGTNYIHPDLFPIIGQEVMRQCDKSDGVEDGIIMDPKSCNFYADSLLCTAGSNQSACLTAPQIRTLEALYRPLVDVNNTWIYPNFGLGSEDQMTSSFGNVGTNAPSLYGSEYFAKYVLNDANWDWHNFDYSIIQLADALNPGDTNADDFDLSEFRARGGKLLHYHGLADGLIPTGASEYLYQQYLSTMNEKNLPLDDFYRFFLIPGMQHCSGSINDAPWYIGGFQSLTGTVGVSGYQDREHDVVRALMDWVENGVAVDKIVATKFKNDDPSQGVVRQRPLCPYPKKTVYNGNGDINDSESWHCEA
ncbi:ferulic acid Esterase/Feruloyl esterase [Penicillium verhagenii]|uniref:ferulic acid Esterase/Feruloyl esterase n=1 Tax=Penicillium verhagenii TaxID=1562060 RepID=UPI002545626C|nr:ferulic acid Esterase/Feruloyl esterase [Penicillium verhagenii]KAJ5938993.1 ferulic acid Esterase/Feruloyl esterase [Penicillium verhagenii]